jgi:hypothetical protein
MIDVKNFVKNSYSIYVAPQTENEELRNAAILFCGEVVRYLDNFKNDASVINSDPNLSEEGKRKKIDTLKPNHVDAMASFTRRALNLNTEYRPQVVKARTAKDFISKDRMLDELRSQEVRSILREQGDIAIRSAYLDAKGDGFVRWSIEQSPIPMITDPEILKRGREGIISEDNLQFIAGVKEFMNILQDVITKACAYLKIPTPVGVAGLNKI